MGGWGSSRWPTGYQRKLWVDEAWLQVTLTGFAHRLWEGCRTLRLLHKSSGTEITIGAALRVGEEDVLAERRVQVELPTGEVVCLTALEYHLRCGHDGRRRTRWYLQCPSCQLRACHLYMPTPSDPLACQRCQRLCHLVQWEPPGMRMARRKLRAELRMIGDRCPKKPGKRQGDV